MYSFLLLALDEQTDDWLCAIRRGLSIVWSGWLQIPQRQSGRRCGVVVPAVVADDGHDLTSLVADDQFDSKSLQDVAVQHERRGFTDKRLAQQVNPRGWPSLGAVEQLE